MTTSIDNPNKTNRKAVAGIIILIIGSVLLIEQLDLFFFPHWLVTWPMFMIGYGIYQGYKYNFKKPFWIWVTVLGFAFLLTQNMDHAERFVWPVAIIGVGTWMVLKHNKRNSEQYQTTDNNYKEI
ncbi:LiaF transmembrane domain-containing protein [Mucilaginibacter sp. X4EP1]|jgi:hypothetical protein|uniref:LiaF transmembrane domain-containing protein n=1 Tax=Mucilaginibacter sp. X4EP1 TaxID=2723092 RepID=UPI002169E8B5|nr:DUF5668 domain-containing protein [Mucilaginibacter sp. X4EP1]MCS3815929.1 hypothetical protein [Mucilaginibacter sp. X4EP1]